MQRKIIYIFNPISGTKNKNALLKKIEKLTTLKGLHFEIITSNTDGDYNYLKEKIENEKITDIIIVGGDGTVNQVTNALKNYHVKFGIIPAGSGNGLAYTAQISKNTNRALETVFNNTSKKNDAFLINDKYACMLSGLGFDAAVAHKFAAAPNRGLLTYIRKTVSHFFKAPAYGFEIIMDDISFFIDAFFISIANSNQFGNNFTIAPKAKLNDGLLDIVIVEKMNKTKLPAAVLKQIRGKNKLQRFNESLDKNGILYFQTNSLTIKNLNLAPLHIDGDPVATAAEFHISILKDCFELIQPL